MTDHLANDAEARGSRVAAMMYRLALAMLETHMEDRARTQRDESSERNAGT